MAAFAAAGGARGGGRGGGLFPRSRGQPCQSRGVRFDAFSHQAALFFRQVAGCGRRRFISVDKRLQRGGVCLIGALLRVAQVGQAAIGDIQFPRGPVVGVEEHKRGGAFDHNAHPVGQITRLAGGNGPGRQGDEQEERGHRRQGRASEIRPKP